MINAIDLKLGSENNYLNEIGGNLEVLSGIRHINIFVGENNSGKSRLMRSLIKKDDAVLLADTTCKPREFDTYRLRLKGFFGELRSKDPQILVCNEYNGLSPCELYVYYKNQYEYYHLRDKDYSYKHHNITSQITDDLNSLYRLINQKHTNGNYKTLKSLTKTYIPVLRGIECFNNYFDTKKNQLLDSISMNSDQRRALEAYKLNAGKIYKNKIQEVYGIPESDIFTGENLYEEIRNKLLGEEQGRRFIKDFEDFISKHFFDNEGFTIIPSLKEGYLFVKIGGSEERALHNLGDGIKQIITILYKAFVLRHQESILCIEEPEINLHPGYQRKLVEILQDKEFEKLYFFITTHSNHIVDSCFDYNNISIYKFINSDKQNKTFKVYSTIPNDIEILNQLGVNNSSVFMANSTIWVEGISDKIYIKKYLKTYIEANDLHPFKEGVDYSFVEYGGNNITHWDFENLEETDCLKASGITNRAFIVLDNDNNSVRKQRRKERLKQVFGDNYYELSVREIENTIGKRLLEKCLFEDNPIYKNGMENKKDSFETVSARIWEYIDNHYQLKKKYWNPHKKQPTVAKLAFAKDVCSKVESIDDLSNSAKELAEKIYGFISGVSQNINH